MGHELARVGTAAHPNVPQRSLALVFCRARRDRQNLQNVLCALVPEPCMVTEEFEDLIRG